MKQKDRPQTADEAKRKSEVRFANKGITIPTRRNKLWEKERGLNQPLALFT